MLKIYYFILSNMVNHNFDDNYKNFKSVNGFKIDLLSEKIYIYMIYCFLYFIDMIRLTITTKP